ncbi:MAG: chromate resistance protein ChrB domain-containing protein [Pseudomonadota bacterium]
MVHGKYSTLVACLLMVIASHASDFSTWEGFEADKCASIWLIKRFIAPEAEIRFYPRGEWNMAGIAFDVPNARFRRYHNKATFETLLEHYQLNDKQLSYIARIIHDIEVNIWEKKRMAETSEVQNAMHEIIMQKDSKKILADCRSYFDRLYSPQKY